MFGILFIISALTAVIYWKVIRPHSHWTRRGVKQAPPTPVLGNNWGLFWHSEPLSHFVQNLYNLFPNERYMGLYQMRQPFLMVRDPELLKQITVKDFDHFTDHMNFVEDVKDPLWSKNLFSLQGEIWKEMRGTLSPAFTSSKMKSMFYLMSKCAEDFTNHFLDQRDNLITLELKDNFTRYTNDIIATCAFGVECNSLKQRENEFYMMGKEATNFSSWWSNLRFVIISVFPKLANLLGLSFFSKNVYKFFINLIGETVKFREEKSIIRPDMIHLLMEARKGRLHYEEQQVASKETGFATVEESTIGITAQALKQEITIEDMTAHALLFFFAGFETVSILMCFMAYELGVNPDIQERLVKEVDDTHEECNGKLTYEALNKMKYMDMIIAETLRKYPAGPVGDRICTKDYTIQPTKESEVPVMLKKGELLWIPTFAIHRDPKYYENPDKFDPERFSDENKSNIKPYTYLPFGLGPRNCIGSRFALLEAKAIFFHLLSKFVIVPVEKTQIPIKLDKNNFNMSAEGGFWLGFKRRSLQ